MLYHGSKTQGIKILKPFPHSVIGGESAVFATPDIRFALAMIHGTGKEIAIGYITESDRKTKVVTRETMYIDELVPNAFALMKFPGFLYTIPEDNFISDKRLSRYELIHKEEVLVSSEAYITNVFEELKKYDINFVSYDDVLEEVKKRNSEK